MLELRWFRIILLGVTALGFTATVSLSAAVDNDTTLTIVSPGTVEGRVLPETAPGGTVVLRGYHSANPEPGQPRPAGTFGNAPAAPRSLPAGWDRNFDTTGIDWRDYSAAGIDRSADRIIYDTSGINRNFDLSGLTRPGAGIR
jgi:hypothetical protein